MSHSAPLAALRAFEAVGRTGSVKRAAAELGVTSGAVTQQIHALEIHLKRRLVQRNGRGIELTVWGRLYLPRLVAGFEELRKAQVDIERAGESGRLLISALPSLATKWLGPLLFAWRRTVPDARAMIVGVHPEPRLDEGEADFRISYGARHRHHTRHLRLFTDRVFVVASPDCLKRVGPIKRPADLLSQPLLWVDWGNEYLALPSWPDWFAAAGIADPSLRPDLVFSLPSASVDAALEGQGFAIAQYSLAASALALGTLVQVFPLDLPLPEAHFLAWSSAALDRPHGAAFHSWLISESRRFDREYSSRR